MEKNMEISGTASSKLQFKMNTSIIFNYLKSNEPISRVEISRHLNISPPAVSRVINFLINEGFVSESEKKVTRSGKRPIMLAIKQDKFHVIGIDLGKEKLSFALTNLKSGLIKKMHGQRISEDLDIAKVLINELKQFISSGDNNLKKGAKLENIKGIGIGVPAAVDTLTGRITGASHYTRWEGLNFKELIEKELKIPVFIDNDVNLSCLAEKNYGIGKKCKNLVFLEISNGVGAGIMIENNLLRGKTGFAGEIGYMVLDFKFFNEGQNNGMFLEKHSSLEAVRAKLLNAIRSGEDNIPENLKAGSTHGELMPELVCRAAMEEDIFCTALINEMVNGLSMGISNLILTLNPEMIILGGDICNMPGREILFLNPIVKKISKSVPENIPEIFFSMLGEDTGIIGASHMAINNLLIKEFPYRIS